MCNDKDGKDISPVAPDVFNDKTLWLKESKTMKKPTIESFTYNPTENIFEDDGETVLKVICVYSADFEQDTPYCRGVASREGDEFVDSQIEAETEKSETFKFPVYLNVNVPDEIGLDDFESVRDKIEEYAIDAFNETNDFKFVKAVSLEFDDATDDVFAESEGKPQMNKSIRDEDDDYYEGDFPAWALDYVVNCEIGSVSRSEKQMIDGWFATMQEQGYDTTMISYGEDEYFSSRPEFGLACDCVSVKVYKAQSR